MFQTYYFYESRNAGFHFLLSWKRRGPKNDEDLSKQSQKSWMRDHYIPENMKLEFGNKAQKLSKLHSSNFKTFQISKISKR